MSSRLNALRSAMRFGGHVMGAAACTAGAVIVAGDHPWRIPFYALLLSLTASLGPVLRELIDTERGVPAPADLQALADELAVAMDMRPIPIGVTIDQPGVAALRGLTRRSRRIVIGEPELRLPTQRLLAIFAHEFAHARARHQQKGLALVIATWSVPQALAGTLIPLAGEHAWTVPLAGVTAGALTGLCVLGLYAVLRAQEHTADEMATALAGEWVSAQLAHHFGSETKESLAGRLYATHPAPAKRAARLLTEL